MLHRSIVATLGLAAGLASCAGAQRAPDISARVRRQLRSLSLEDRVAQLIMPWLPGTYTAADAEGLAKAVTWVDSLHVGGIIVSIGSPLDIAAKINALQRRSSLPLLIAADLEAGSAFRFTGGTPFPTNMGVGATGRERDAYEMGRITAAEARAVGIHVTFSPVADINSNPANPIINTRSFGGDPAAVARLVRSAVLGTQEGGLLATVKHFPGHGDTETDSHLALPVIKAGWDRLRRVELVPFKAAIDAGVALVMTGHVALPAIDTGPPRPATLSPFWLTDVLRDSLGFTGLVVTDALDMGALVATYGGGEAAVRAFVAGSDLLLQPKDPAEVLNAMTAAVRSGRISEERLNRSVARVLAIKERLRLNRERTVKLEDIPEVVGRQAFLDSARAITERALVLVRDSLGVVESLRRGRDSVTIITFGEATSPGLGAGFAAELGQQGLPVARAFRLSPASGPASYDSAAAVIRTARRPVFVVAVRAVSSRGSVAMPPPLADLIQRTARARPTLLVSFGSPYLLSQTPGVAGYLLAWSSNPLTEQAAARALGGAAISGRLPIDLPPFYRIGDGLNRPRVEGHAGSRRP